MRLTDGTGRPLDSLIPTQRTVTHNGPWGDGSARSGLSRGGGGRNGCGDSLAERQAWVETLAAVPACDIIPVYLTNLGEDKTRWFVGAIHIGSYGLEFSLRVCQALVREEPVSGMRIR